MQLLLRNPNSFLRVSERLGIGEIEQAREIDRQVVAEFVLGEWRAVPIGDLPARRRDIEDESARLLLCFPGRLNRFFRWRRGWAGGFLREPNRSREERERI